MSAFSTAKPKKIDPLDRVIKKNPKYDYIKPTIDTGSSLTKYLKKIEEIKTNYKYQQDEIFKRMKITTFVQLLLQVAEVDSVEKDSKMEYESSRYDGNSSRNVDTLAEMSDRNISPVPSLALTEGDYGAQSTNRHSTLQSVIRGIGELDVYEKEKKNRKYANAERNLVKLQQDLDLPYLLLDLRDKDEYDQCHIISAINYPSAMLSRSINNETPELLAYKNQPGKIIVVYDDEERIAPKAASTLVQRGYDNLFLLSGGLRLASKKFPDGLITGSLPAYYALPTPKDSKTGRSFSSSILNSSNASNITNRSFASKRTFDREDIEKLNQHLDENLMPSDSLSRMSRNTKSSRNSTISNVSLASNKTVTSIHDKPWKPI